MPNSNKTSQKRNLILLCLGLIPCFVIFLSYFFESDLEPTPLVVVAPPIPEPVIETIFIPEEKEIEIVEAITEPIIEQVVEPVTWTISGNVIGLNEGQQVQIRLRSGEIFEKRRILTDQFSFTNVITDQNNYWVKIISSPAGLNCNTLNANGIAKHNISDIKIICRPPKPSIALTKSFIITEGEKQLITPEISYLSSKENKLSYKWINLSGDSFKFQPLGKSLSVTAPDKAATGTFKLIVTDEYQQSTSEIITIAVNLKPQFELPEKLEGYAFQPFVISPSNVYDESDLTYSWQVTENDKVELDITDSTSARIENLPRPNKNFTINLTLTDEHGVNTTRSTKVTVTSMLLTEVEYTSELVRSCVETAAKKHHWKRVADVSSLECIDAGITSFKDFEIFTMIYNLDLTDNQISKVDLSHHIDLRSLYLTNNKLTEIDLSRTTRLKVLGLSDNQLNTIDVSKQPKLTYLGLSTNQLTDIGLNEQTKLESLYLNNNQLSEIDLDQQTLLKTLDLSGNKLTSIALKNQVELTNLNLNNNKLSSVDLIHNALLEELFIIDNPLLNSTKLYLTTTGIESLYFEEIISPNNLYNPDGTINIKNQIASRSKK